MGITTSTDFSNRCYILCELWMGYRDDEQFSDFVEYNDLGFPLAYLIAKDVVKSTAEAEKIIDETWELFLQSLEVEDTGFESLAEVFGEEEEDVNND